VPPYPPTLTRTLLSRSSTRYKSRLCMQSRC
jgi:hypothetical protein